MGSSSSSNKKLNQGVSLFYSNNNTPGWNQNTAEINNIYQQQQYSAAGQVYQQQQQTQALIDTMPAYKVLSLL